MTHAPATNSDEAEDHVATRARRDVQQQQEDARRTGAPRRGRAGRRRCRGRSPTSRPSARGTAAAAGANGPSRGRLLDEERPVLGQVAGKEHDEDDLQQLRRLPADRPEARGVSRAPLTSRPRKNVSEQQADARRRPGVLVEAQPAVGPDDDRQDRGDRDERSASHDELDVGRGRGRGRRVLRRPGPGAGAPSGAGRSRRASPTAGSRTWSVRRPARTCARWAMPNRRRGRSGDGALGVRPRRSPGSAHALGVPERHAPDEERDRDDREQPGLAPPRPGPDRAEDRRQRGAARRSSRRASSARGRSSRNRTWPTWSTSPNPSGATPSTGAPLTNVPFVLPRSSTYQRPAAERKDGVLGRRERVLDDDRVVDVAAERRDRVEAETRAHAGSPAGEATTTRRPSSVPGSRAAARRSRTRVRATANRKK